MKKYIVLGLSIGAGAVLAAVLAVIAIYLYNQPSGWNKRALRAVRMKAAVITPIDLSASLVPKDNPRETPEEFMQTRAEAHNNKSGFTIDGQSPRPPSPSGVLKVDVENATSQDIAPPKTAKVMLEAKDSRALTSSWMSLDTDYFIPAGHVFEVSLQLDLGCSGAGPAVKCLDTLRETFKDYSQIVILNDLGESRSGVPLAGSTKYELDIPIQKIEWPK